MGRQPIDTVILADRDSWTSPVKKHNGSPVELVYVQAPRRKYSRSRRKSTWYIWRLQGETMAFRNKGPQDYYFLAMGGRRSRDVRRYYDTFIRPPLTASEKKWLDDHGYVQAGAR